MKYIKTFESFSGGEFSKIEEANEASAMEVGTELAQEVLSKMSDSEKTKLAADLRAFAAKHGISQSELADPKTAMEVFTEIAKETIANESYEYDIDENVGNWFASVYDKGKEWIERHLGAIVGWTGGIASVSSMVMSILAGAYDNRINGLIHWARDFTGIGEFDRGAQAALFTAGFVGFLASFLLGTKLSVDADRKYGKF